MRIGGTLLFAVAALGLNACVADTHSHAEDDHVDGLSAHADGHAVPHEYEGAANPLAGMPEAVQAGHDIYADQCANCHGVSGTGDGPHAATHDPMPSDLTDAHVQDTDDAYLMFRVSEGGIAPYNSAMPAFKGILSETERWQVIGYLRSLSSTDMAGAHPDDDAMHEEG